MKQLNIKFKFFMFLFLSTKMWMLDGVDNFKYYQEDKKINNLCHDGNLFFLSEPLRIIEQIKQNFAYKVNEFGSEKEYEEQQKFIDDILIVLFGTYQKIISATVTYYFTYHNLEDQNLHESITVILHDDILVIMEIITSACVKFIKDPKMTWEKKIYYLVTLATSMIIVKFGIDIISDEEKENIYVLSMKKNE